MTPTQPPAAPDERIETNASYEVMPDGLLTREQIESWRIFLLSKLKYKQETNGVEINRLCDMALAHLDEQKFNPMPTANAAPVPSCKPTGENPELAPISPVSRTLAADTRDVTQAENSTAEPDELMRVAEELAKQIELLIQNTQPSLKLACDFKFTKSLIGLISDTLQSAGAQQAAQIEALREALSDCLTELHWMVAQSGKELGENSSVYRAQAKGRYALITTAPQPGTKDD